MTWRDQAHCLGANPELLYTPDVPWRRHPALTYCDTCPVKAECLDDALALGPFGQFYVRGGFTAAQRRQMLRDKGAA